MSTTTDSDTSLHTLVRKFATEEVREKLRSLREAVESDLIQIKVHDLERNPLRRDLCVYFGKPDQDVAAKLKEKLNANCEDNSKIAEIAHEFLLLAVVLAQGIDPVLAEFAAQDLGPTSTDPSASIKIIDTDDRQFFVRGKPRSLGSDWSNLLFNVRPITTAELAGKLKDLTPFVPGFVWKLTKKLDALDAQIHAEDEADRREACDARQRLEEFVTELERDRKTIESLVLNNAQYSHLLIDVPVDKIEMTMDETKMHEMFLKFRELYGGLPQIERVQQGSTNGPQGKLQLGLLLLLEWKNKGHEPTVTEIAQALEVDRKALYRRKGFAILREKANEFFGIFGKKNERSKSDSDRPKGTKAADGRIEAWNDSNETPE